MFTTPKHHVLPHHFTRPRPQIGLRLYTLALLAIALMFLMGCTTFASTAVIFTVAGNQPLDNAPTIAPDNTTAILANPAAIPEPGFDVPITSTLWLRSLQTNSMQRDAALQPEPALPVALPKASPAANYIAEAAPVTDPSLPAVPPATLDQPGQIEHVVIITIDGLRPDALDLAHTPTLDNLRERGAYSPNAQTVNPSFTLPSHVSMLTGVNPADHGIVEALPCIGCRLSIGPTLFNVAHNAGLSTAAVFGKEKLSYLVADVSVEHGAVDHLFSADVHDTEVKDNAVEFIEAGLPNLLFVHFPDTDAVGHEFGWMSENQLFAINYADTMIGEIVTALEDGNYLDTTLIIVTADHGGHGFKHGDDSPVDRTIPWLAAGPGVPQNVVLSSPIVTLDTAATAAHALNLPLPERWQGRPVLEIFQ